ncbi:MAG: ATP-binding protein [Sulfuricurvum sp.]
MKSLQFKIELNVLNHLGIGLYSSTPAVITEMISNAWDADAHNVNIQIEPNAQFVIVEDDGHGMSEFDVENKFLKVGYSRREQEDTKHFSRSRTRRVMGRKGIGKLAMFSLANTIEIVTKSADQSPVAFMIDVPKLKEACNKNLPYDIVQTTIPEDFKYDHGTRITLKDLNSRLHKTAVYLRPKLARRFSVIGKSHDFNINLNDTPLERNDAGFYKDIQFFWSLGEIGDKEVEPLAINIATVEETGKKCVAKFTEEISIEIKTNSDSEDESDPKEKKYKKCTIDGYIATVDTPTKLGKHEDSLNRIAIFANGRIFQEDILLELGSARYANSYIVGEVHANFLDTDNIDRATASREAIKHDDDEYEALRSHLKTLLDKVRNQWDEWRRALGYSKTTESIAGVTEWIEHFPDKRDRKLANQLMTSIANLPIAEDVDKDKEAKKLLFRSTIVGFEKLRIRNKLDELEHVYDVLSPEFQSIFSTLNDVEESYYLEIVKSRLDVIRKFQKIIDDKDLEKVAQKYLFNHLWLLDPTWDRVSGSEKMERTVTEHLKKVCPDTVDGARLDIDFRTNSGRHIIVELKKPGRKMDVMSLVTQGRKYAAAMTEYFNQTPDLHGNAHVPTIEIYMLISEIPSLAPNDDKMFESHNMRLLTYKTLITNAEKAYEEYLDVHKAIGKVESFLKKI